VSDEDFCKKITDSGLQQVELFSLGAENDSKQADGRAFLPFVVRIES